ncbi:MAG: ABC transporter substrate-binding protein [Candidatus Sumerlaeaceae bacterium]|nr:ABC transporter substrate-binding protein [Candidatus Sumerlaeaceae bacterium]
MKMFSTAKLVGAALALAVLIPAPSLRAEEAKVVRLGYFPNITHAQAVVGVGRGDFQKALGPDVKLDTLTVNAGPSITEAIFAGRLDLAYVGPSPTISGFQASKGEEIRVVSGAALNGVLVIGNKKRGITKLEQLKGGRIATPQLGNTQDISAKHYVVDNLHSQLKEKGGDTEVIPVNNPDIEILFEKDQIDAAWVPEPWGTRIVDKGLANIIAEEKDLWPEKKFVLTNIVARREFLEKNPELVKKFLAAHVALTKELQENPRQFDTILNSELKRLTGKDLPPALLDGSFKHVSFATDPSPESFKAFFEHGKQLGLVRGDSLDVNKLIDTTLLKQVLATAPATARSADAPTSAPAGK